ncbi:cupin domain-containing protein [Cryphonectria parasitica EP155]|uniref:Cupin domain-containing protein n=1 Tax=Cryphonectria parasitica (strain ATCC 38755 / EP155) TaxID=660469 RepID=A0A9P5CM04_CRYP1|nr:cupin domain-containing protein [Cryphonectria parasitica EP155]KAF3762365.1 cupin domain-containing protein [Cryphonectria parasitica EP155]
MADQKNHAQGQTSPLRTPHRFITDHNPQGLAVFNTTLAPALPAQAMQNGDKFYLGYTTTAFPPSFTNNADITSYARDLSDPPGVVRPGGTVLRLVDIRPGGESPMHRTVSLDYGVVLEGEVEAVLDSGQTRLLRRGDVVVQRGTNHLWRNASGTEWARMLYVLQEAQPVEVAGRALREDYGVGMEDVRPSGN